MFDESYLGYGAACLKGISKLSRSKQLEPSLVVFVDGDLSVDASELPLLLDELIKGNDLVVGNRAAGLQQKSALSIHQRFGNYLASTLIRKIWNQPVNDLGPFRAMKYHSLLQLNMQDKRFGWTVEMQYKAASRKLDCIDIDVPYRRRNAGVSKISGSIKGSIKAGYKILMTIFCLWCGDRCGRWFGCAKQKDVAMDD